MMAHGRCAKVALSVLGSAVPLSAPGWRAIVTRQDLSSNMETIMTKTLITGANKGLGRETARRLLADGHDVWVAARDAERGEPVARDLGARFVQLDVTDEASVWAARDRVEAEGGLDVLINNAGIVGVRRPFEEVTADDVRVTYETNVFGVIRVTQAFVPLLAQSDSPVIVNVSSGMGSLAVTTDAERLESTIVALAYPSSKSALNMITTQYAKALPAMRVNAVDPGYTSTDLNGHRGTQSVQEGAEAIVRMAEVDGNGLSGTFVDRNGSVPW
jgi:NAD(P)-dependent dehydrogenase (short-subunit alcohol dehydrogenase family)